MTTLSERSLLALCLITILSGCVPAEIPRVHSKIGLKFESISDSEVTFTLANGLDRAVQIQGKRSLLRATIRMWPPDAGIACWAATSGLTEELGSFVDHGSKLVDISSGERVKLIVETTLPQRFAGGRCSLRLLLKDGATAGPIEFSVPIKLEAKGDRFISLVVP